MGIFLGIPLGCLQKGIERSLQIASILLEDPADIFLAVCGLSESAFFDEDLDGATQTSNPHYAIF
jgi:hypothetical protein